MGAGGYSIIRGGHKLGVLYLYNHDPKKKKNVIWGLI